MDAGFAGTTVHVASRGVALERSGDRVTVTVAAGEPWDDLVTRLVGEGLSGVNATNYRKPNDPKTTALICDVAATTQRLIKGRHTVSKKPICSCSARQLSPPTYPPTRRR